MPHPHMIFDLEECEQLSSLPQKNTVLITTGQAHLNFLMWSVFSVLLRSKVGGFLEHINVAINGPDARCGDPTLQDQKQAFLEELRNLKWQSEVGGPKRDMPLTVIRVWSRVGAEQAVEMAVPWVHTDSYTYIHDDTLWLTKGWENIVMKELYQDKVAMVYPEPFYTGHLSWSVYDGKPKLNFPHTISPCMICRKPIFAKCGIRWTGYHFTNEFTVEEKVKEMAEFLNAHKPNVLPLPSSQRYGFASYDIGSWVYYTLKSQGYKLNPVKDLHVHHFVSMSWSADPERVRAAEFHIQNLEKDIRQFPEYWDLYMKFKKEL